MLRFGPADGPVVVMALPLFEEANRVRAFAVSILRALAEHGVASALPDLPAQGESEFPSDTLSLIELEAAHEACVEQLGTNNRTVYAASIRSGWLADVFSPCQGHWRLAPQDGPALSRELTLIKQAELGKTVGELWFAQKGGVEVAGHRPSLTLMVGLLAAELPTQRRPELWNRVVRLTTDPREADFKLPGTPLWRRAEPAHDRVLAQALAADIAQWVETCEGC